MKKIKPISSLSLLFILTACASQQGAVKKPNFQNPDPKKYYINHNGCLKKKPLWSQLGV